LRTGRNDSLGAIVIAKRREVPPYESLTWIKLTTRAKEIGMKITRYLAAIAIVLVPGYALADRPSSLEIILGHRNDLEDLVGGRNESLYGHRNEVEEHWESQYRYEPSDSGRIDWYSSRWQSSNERSESQGDWRKNKKSRRSWNSD
jgi:hypothetical protein